MHPSTHAKAMMMTMCAALAFPIEERVYKEYNEDKKKGLVKHLRKINRTFALVRERYFDRHLHHEDDQGGPGFF